MKPDPSKPEPKAVKAVKGGKGVKGDGHWTFFNGPLKDAPYLFEEGKIAIRRGVRAKFWYPTTGDCFQNMYMPNISRSQHPVKRDSKSTIIFSAFPVKAIILPRTFNF